MCLREGVDGAARRGVERALTGVVQHGVRPLTVSEWRGLLESEGFRVVSTEKAPMALLEPARLIRDEGLTGALPFALNVARDRQARRRVLEMHCVFRRHRGQIAAVTVCAVRG